MFTLWTDGLDWIGLKVSGTIIESDSYSASQKCNENSRQESFVNFEHAVIYPVQN